MQATDGKFPGIKTFGSIGKVVIGVMARVKSQPLDSVLNAMGTLTLIVKNAQAEDFGRPTMNVPIAVGGVVSGLKIMTKESCNGLQRKFTNLC